jgi:SAM-dependent methyltransferase
MLQDQKRCETYREAILEAVRPGCSVLDIGAGTGILSLFAVQAGAQKVYAVERTSIAEFARQMVKINGAEEWVEVIQGEMETVELPEKVDVIVSELLGHLGVDENLLPPMLIARDRWLKPRGRILPGRVSTWMAPVEDKKMEQDLVFWRSRPYGMDLSLIAYAVAQEVHRRRKDIRMDHLLAEPRRLWTTDLYAHSTDKAHLPFQASLSFLATRQGSFSALAGWFCAEFDNRLILTNAPSAPDTHWGRVTFSLERPKKVHPGTEIMVEFTCESAGPSDTLSRWSVRVGEEPWEHHVQDKLAPGGEVQHMSKERKPQ